MVSGRDGPSSRLPHRFVGCLLNSWRQPGRTHLIPATVGFERLPPTVSRYGPPAGVAPEMSPSRRPRPPGQSGYFRSENSLAAPLPTRSDSKPANDLLGATGERPDEPRRILLAFVGLGPVPTCPENGRKIGVLPVPLPGRDERTSGREGGSGVAFLGGETVSDASSVRTELRWYVCNRRVRPRFVDECFSSPIPARETGYERLRVSFRLYRMYVPIRAKTLIPIRSSKTRLENLCPARPTIVVSPPGALRLEPGRCLPYPISERHRGWTAYYIFYS